MKPYIIAKRNSPPTLKDFTEWNPHMSIVSLKKAVLDDRKEHERIKRKNR